MKTFFTTRVSFLSRLLTAGRQTLSMYSQYQMLNQQHHKLAQQKHSFALQIGVSDKCAKGSPCHWTTANFSSSSAITVTYLGFSHNFTRLDITLKKWPHFRWSNVQSITALGLLRILSDCTHRTIEHTSSLTAPNNLNNFVNKTNLNHTTNTTTSLGNHCSLIQLSGSFDVYLSADKLAVKFVCATTTGNIHLTRNWTIKATQNNKWTLNVAEETRLQEHFSYQQKQLLQKQVTSFSRYIISIGEWGKEKETPLTSHLAGCNAFNKLIISNCDRIALLPYSTRSPMIHQLPNTTSILCNSIRTFSITTSRSAVNCEIICHGHLLMKRMAQVWQQYSSFWTCMAMHNSETHSDKHWYVLVLLFVIVM